MKHIPITHDIMRSLNAAITYIEKLGGLGNEELYRDIAAGAYSSLVDEIMVCKGQILRHYPSGHSIRVSSISHVMDNVTVVSEALTLGLKSCEPLVPYQMNGQVLQIQRASDIKRLLPYASTGMMPPNNGDIDVSYTCALNKERNVIATTLFVKTCE